MSKESTRAAFQKAYSNHTLLNLSQEEEDAVWEYYGLEKPTNSEHQLMPNDSPTTKVEPQTLFNPR